MRQNRQTGRPRGYSNLHRSTPEPEHGDWRVQVHNAEEVEHMVPNLNGFRNVFHRTRVVARALLETTPEDIIPIHGWPRAVRLALALFVLLPFSLVAVCALAQQIYHSAAALGEVGFWTSIPVWYAMMGALVFTVLIVSGMMHEGLVLTYVLGHELTHAITAKLCFGKVSTFKVDRDGGYVETDKNNLFIALSPYFVPIWMLVWMGVLWLINFAFPFEEYGAWFYAGFGFWWFFHLYWTIWIIPREQPDMLENGLLFSLLAVIGVNLLILIAILCCFNVITLQGFWQDFQDSAREMYQTFADLLGLL